MVECKSVMSPEHTTCTYTVSVASIESQHTLRLSRRSIWLTALSLDTLTTMAVTVGPNAAVSSSGVVLVSSSTSCSSAAMTAISCLRWLVCGRVLLLEVGSEVRRNKLG